MKAGNKVGVVSLTSIETYEVENSDKEEAVVFAERQFVYSDQRLSL